MRRIAGAPITWGVCEVPGWGHQMSPERVLSEMASIGLQATELGPDGFLPSDPTRLAALLTRHRLTLVGGFVPAVLHDESGWAAQLVQVERQVATFAAGGSEMVVLAAATGTEGYEGSLALTDGEWRQLVAAVSDVERLADRYGLAVSLHPHYGTVIEKPAEIWRLLESSGVGLCLDTGHVMVGGGDPVEIAREAAERITHVHLKDVDARTAERVRAGDIGYHQGVVEGMYRALGDGDIDLATIIGALDGVGYDGWYVLEQDTVVEVEPPPGVGPAATALASYRFLQ